MQDIATGFDVDPDRPDAQQPGPIITIATRPFGVRVTHTATSTVATEWFDTLPKRAAWMAKAKDVTYELRPLVRLTDHDEVGTFLGRREVISLPALAGEARDQTHQAARQHAAIRHQIAAAELRAFSSTATTIVADLSAPLAGEGNPFIEEIRDATGAAVWAHADWFGGTAAIDHAAEQLGMALDYLDPESVGWVPMTIAEVADWGGDPMTPGEYYTLTLPVTAPLPNIGTDSERA